MSCFRFQETKMKNPDYSHATLEQPSALTHRLDSPLTGSTVTPLLRSVAVVLLTCLAWMPGRVAGEVVDDFESYAVGSNLHGQGGWAGWADDPTAGALVSNDFSFSPTQSVKISGASDLVRTFSGATNGQWVFSVMQYVPSTSSGTNYVILMNTYRPPYQASDLNWSVQIQCDMTGGWVVSDLGGGAMLPMIKDRWVEVRCEINLTSNLVSEFYNGQLLSTHAWQGNSGTPGLSELQALDLYANNAGPVYYDALSLTERGVVIRVETGRKSQGCTGFGICNITIEPGGGTTSIPAAATWSNGRLQLSFLSDPPNKTDVLAIDEDIVLDPATARALGYEHVTLRAGQYPVDYSRNPYGQVSPDVSARGIIITIYIGLRNCKPGFGICDVTIEFPATDRAVPAAATWENGRLQLNFLAEPADKTNVLVLEEDVVLNTATSRVLGYEQVTLRAGQYPVDYSVNPYGQVSPDVTVQGPIVTIDLRRRCLGGFGFCRITIDPLASTRAVPAAATWIDGRLRFSFLAEPRDKTNVLVLDEDIVLDGATSRALGYEHVTLRAGQYPVDYSVNPHGQVRVDVATRGLIIWVRIGIPKAGGCVPGFGICGIGTGNPPFDRAVPVAATVEHGSLKLGFLSDPPDNSNMLTIEEDVVLDAATAHALGYEHLTLRAGQYPRDDSENPHGDYRIIIQLGGLIITVDVGRGTNCQDFGICRLTIESTLTARSVPAAAEWVNGRLQLSFLSEPPDKTNVLTIDEDLVLDSTTARALGYEHVILRAGQYPVDFSVSPHGQVSPDVTVQGLVITIDLRRRCWSGFGFCSITIGPLASARAVPAAANWVNGRLRLDFLTEPPDKTNVLILDEDLILDAATSRALGYEQVTLRAGQYPVDFSANPHGQVSPDVLARAPIVNIQIWRRNAGAPCSPGFGLCGVTIEISLSARDVPTAAEWVNGRLQLSFLSEPPDKTNVWTVDQDVVLDRAISRLLGYDQVTIRAGQYPVDYSRSPYGQVSPDTTVQGLTIWVRIGLPSLGCRGFGLCGIGTGNPPWERGVQATATWVNDDLHLGFLSEPPDKTNILVLEQDLPLDPATSRLLGHEQVTLRAGQYAVDYSQNPNGEVAPATIIQEKLSIGYASDGTLTLTWPGVGWTLQTSTNLLGPWMETELQTSPVNVATSEPRRYFRLIKP